MAPLHIADEVEDRAVELLRALAVEMLGDIEHLAADIGERVAQLVSAPAALDDSSYLDMLRRSTTTNLEAFLSGLAYGTNPSLLDPPNGTLELVDLVACDAHGLPVLLRIYRIGAAQTWRHVAERLGARIDDAAVLSALILLASERLNEYADHIVQCLTERWDERRLEVAQRGLQRDALIRALMRGESIDLDALRYPFERHHVAFATPSSEERATARPGPAPTIMQRLPSGPSIALNGHAGVDIVWLSFDTEPARAQIYQLARTLSGHVGVSATASGVDGFVTVAHEARDTLNAAIKLHPSGGVATFHNSALITTLLASSPLRARRFAEVILGPLAVDSPEAERLRTTLYAYYACGGSKVAASSILLVHEKTVAYRLRQASRQLGISIDTHRVDIEAALSVLSATR